MSHMELDLGIHFWLISIFDPFWGTLGVQVGVKIVKRAPSRYNWCLERVDFQLYVVTHGIICWYPFLINFNFWPILGHRRGQSGQKVPVSLHMMFRTCKSPQICYFTQRIAWWYLFLTIFQLFNTLGTKGGQDQFQTWWYHALRG